MILEPARELAAIYQDTGAGTLAGTVPGGNWEQQTRLVGGSGPQEP